MSKSSTEHWPCELRLFILLRHVSCMYPRLCSNRAAGGDLERLTLLPERQNYRRSLSGASSETGISCTASSRPLAPNTSFNIYSSGQGKEAT